MKVFDKEFDVEFIDFDDKSKENSISRVVHFKVAGEIYRYVYAGGSTMALSSVVKIDRETKKQTEVYSAWKHIPDGGYYEEIGRRLSISNHNHSGQ